MMESSGEGASSSLKVSVHAARGIAEVIRSSLGPRAMNKMMVGPFGEVLVTNDGATVLRRLDVQHPSGKLFVQLSEAQERDVGDGTTGVVLLAAELLTAMHRLVERGIPATQLSAGLHAMLPRLLEELEALSLEGGRVVEEGLEEACDGSSFGCGPSDVGDREADSDGYTERSVDVIGDADYELLLRLAKVTLSTKYCGHWGEARSSPNPNP